MAIIEYGLIVVTTTYYNDKRSHRRVNLLIGYQVGNSQENLTRSLFLINVLFIQRSPGLCYNYLTCPIVHAPFSCPPHFLLKTTICTPCVLTSSSRLFYHVLDLWRHIMWPVMWLLCHVPASLSFQENKIKKKKSKIRKIKENKIKIIQCPSVS